MAQFNKPQSKTILSRVGKSMYEVISRSFPRPHTHSGGNKAHVFKQ